MTTTRLTTALAAALVATASWASAPEPETASPRDRIESLRLAQQPDPRRSCAYKPYCRDVSSCEEACFLLIECGFQDLDRDDDGIPCENVCGTRQCE